MSSTETEQTQPITVNNPQRRSTSSVRGNTSGVLPVPPTFFDGTYFSGEDGIKPDDAEKEHRNPHPFFDYSVPRWRYVYNGTLIVLDLLVTILAAAIVCFVYNPAYNYILTMGPGEYGVIAFLVIIGASWLISLGLARSYERHTMGEGYSLYSKLITATFIDFVALCTFGYLFKLNIPRSLNVFVPLVSLLLVIIERWLMRRALHRNRRKGVFNYPTVVIGSPKGIRKVIAQLNDAKSLGYAPIAVCPVAALPANDQDPNAPQHLVSVPFTPSNDDEAKLRVLPLNSHLPQSARHLKARAVLITDVLTRDSETMRTLSLAVESMGIELAMTASVADLSGAILHLRNDPMMPVLTARLPQYSAITRITKRFFDIILSIVALILSSPLTLWAAYKIKREDGGPVFYTQQRIGIYGQPFTIYKFRSMRMDADKMDAQVAAAAGVELGTTFKLKEDPRITKIGRFIRKTSIDEIPQFLNVLKGDMSLVGPRPQRQYEVDQYSTLYSTRLLVKPGITGPWQISGRSDLSQEQAEFADVSYIQEWSITGDIAILFKTVAAVLKGTGSY